MSEKQTTTQDGEIEERILGAMKFVLANIIRETASPPGIKHPLSDETIGDIRQCLTLITSREQELQERRGENGQMRPQTPADRARPAEVAVNIDKLRK